MGAKKEGTNVKLLRGERACADTRRVRLDDADRRPNRLRGDAQARTYAADGGRGRGHEGVRAKVDVEHQRVGALDEHLLALAERLVDVHDAVDDIRPQPLREDLCVA